MHAHARTITALCKGWTISYLDGGRERGGGYEKISSAHFGDIYAPLQTFFKLSCLQATFLCVFRPCKQSPPIPYQSPPKENNGPSLIAVQGKITYITLNT